MKLPVSDCLLSAALDWGPLPPCCALSPRSLDATRAAAPSSPSRAPLSLPFFQVPRGSVLGPLFLLLSALPVGDHVHSGGFLLPLSAHGLQSSSSAQNPLLRPRLINPDPSWNLIRSFSKDFLGDSQLPDTVVGAGHAVVKKNPVFTEHLFY